jgi:hypothetical protein
MKRSKEITLVLLAAVSLVSCGSQSQKTHRGIHANREKLVED